MRLRAFGWGKKKPDARTANTVCNNNLKRTLECENWWLYQNAGEMKASRKERWEHSSYKESHLDHFGLSPGLEMFQLGIWASYLALENCTLFIHHKRHTRVIPLWEGILVNAYQSRMQTCAKHLLCTADPKDQSRAQSTQQWASLGKGPRARGGVQEVCVCQKAERSALEGKRQSPRER